jgi:putative transposase
MPVENAFFESINGRFRDECLSQTWFTDLDDAQAAMAAWKEDYNESRPHTSLGGMAPQQYIAQLLVGEALEETL